ncbi:hypothetical protein GGS26DRAFT_572855 [Hypomontagnella submonticulosa]|nr:hypothetical protein GGS26DRAFT_572855 [Hypomontagnella submonticulosa]
MPTDMGPVILLQTVANPIHECLLLNHTSHRNQRPPRDFSYVNAASQEDDGFVFITVVHAVILSWEIEPTSSTRD